MAKKLSGIDMMQEDWWYRNRGHFTDRFISLRLGQNSVYIDEKNENIRENQIRVV